MKKTILLIFINISINAQNFKQVDSLLEQGNYQFALNLLESTRNKSFKNLDKTASIYQKTGNYRTAIPIFEKAIKINNSLIVKEKLGKSYHSNGNSKKAITLFKEILKTNPNNFLLKYYIAKLYFNRKEYKNAELLFVDLTKNDSLNANYTYLLGKTYFELKQLSKAKKQFLKTLKKDSLYHKSAYKLAKIYRKEKVIDSMNLYLKKGLSIDPNSVVLNQLNIKVAYKNNDFNTVILGVQKLDTLNSNSKFYENLLGYAYYHSKQYQKAEKVLKNLVFAKKADEKTVYYLALANKELKNYEQAMYYLFMSIQLKTPKLNQDYYQLGLVFKELHKPESAIQFFKKSVKEKAYNPDALYELALLSEDYFKDKKIALAHYKNYLNLFEGNHKQRTLYVKQQIKKINTLLFMKEN